MNFSHFYDNFCLLQPLYNPPPKKKLIFSLRSICKIKTEIRFYSRNMDPSLNYYDNVAMISYCNFVLGENVGNHLRSHFYEPRDWLKNNQSRGAISTSAVPPYVRAFFKLTPFYFDTNDVTRNLDCWRSRRQKVARYIRGRSSHERLYAHRDLEFSFFQPLNLYGPATKTTLNWKNCFQGECYS